MQVIEHVSRPRVGLLGNPSDLDRGRVLGFTFEDFAARAQLRPAERCRLVGPGGEALDWGRGLEPQLAGQPGGLALMLAALRRLRSHAPDQVDVDARPFELQVSSDIPRQAGLSGSSAIVVSSLRVLAGHFGVMLGDFACSEQALAAETIELGQVAGPQDRVLQSYGGLLYMDFSEPRRDDRYQRLDPLLLPPLLVAYDTEPGQDSGGVHAGVRERWEAGDPKVRAGVSVFSELAARGLDDLRRGDLGAFADRIDANLAARRALWDVQPRDLDIARRAKEAGAAAKLCGSGGALVIVPRPGVSLDSVRSALEPSGWTLLAPTLH